MDWLLLDWLIDWIVGLKSLVDCLFLSDWVLLDWVRLIAFGSIGWL